MNRARIILAILAASFLVAGLAEPFVARPGQLRSPTEFVHTLAIGILCYMWCKADATVRGAIPPNGAALWSGLFPPIGIPLYFFRSLPLRQALVRVGKAVLFALLLVALAALGALAGEALHG